MLLDPTTYLSFGATKAGKKAAESYTKHATKAALKSAVSLDDIAKFAREGFDPKRFQKLLDVSEASAQNYLSKFAKKKDMARFMNKVNKTARKEALKMTAREAQERLVKNALKNKEEFIDQASKRLAKIYMSCWRRICANSLEGTGGIWRMRSKCSEALPTKVYSNRSQSRCSSSHL